MATMETSVPKKRGHKLAGATAGELSSRGVFGVRSFREFINEELVLFSQYDVVRSIPSVVDGLKPSQRKVLHACFKRKLREEIKVLQLAGFVSEHTAYHHGEESLQKTIVHMAQAGYGSLHPAR